jgi:malonyl CoA-acyl carrier protein transacylase
MSLPKTSKIASESRFTSISFVWRPREITQPVLQMAQRTGSRAIFDFSALGVEGMAAYLQAADPIADVRDIKVSIAAFFDPSLGQLLERTGVRNIWVQCHSLLSREDTALLLGRLRELSASYGCYPITGDRNLLAAMVKETSGVGRVVLKGCEASGFVSGETTATLYATVKEMLSAGTKPLDIIIWGGVATPEAAAAFITTGAAGLVFESLHWLTDLVDIDEAQRQRIGKLRLDATELVGVNLQVPCRLFNKGNSLAFKKIKAFENSLYEGPIDEESRGRLVSRVVSRALPALESSFGQDEVIALGVEASFAASFAERFGSGTGEAVQAFMNEIGTCCDRAEATRDSFQDSPVARELGTRYPFVQGAMSWITDVPEFALRIAEAGGLPTVALGMMDAQALDRRLGSLPEIMAGRRYALNLISLAENPHREAQLVWIKQQKPRFVVIAGGDLSPAKELMECGIKVVYIAPDAALLRLALEAGVNYVAFEGYEAGGHVGQQSTLTLAQMVLDLKRRTPELFQKTQVVLAGGIYNRETAFIAAMLGADAVQMGTAYLTTREAVETGALVPLYQRMILKSRPEGTVVSGQDTGLRVRSLNSPRVAAILSLERAFAAGQRDEGSFRKEMEEMAGGSLYAAARGLDRPGGALLDEAACLERGQFMSGSCAGLIREERTLEALHGDLAEGPLELQHPTVGEFGKVELTALARPLTRELPAFRALPAPLRGTAQNGAPERIAITGMSILNSLGKSPEEVWAASLALKSGITTVPASRWDHRLFYDPRPLTLDKTYCQVGAFLDFPVSRAELGIPPQDFRTMTEATKLTLWLAEKAIQDSGILNSDIPRERIGVVISQNSGEAAGTLTSIIIRAYAHDIMNAVNRAVPLTPEQASAVEHEIKAGRMAPDDTTLLGRLNCAAPGFICNKYGFTGPSYAVSAACASSLVALYNAILMIRSGVIDAAIVGGSEDNITHLHFLEFAAVGALYGMSGRERPARETSRPFDAERDGMVLGEGGGMIVIERESLARARGARIDAFITGMGASNNNLGMVESNSLTQEMAIRASFSETPYGPDAVDLVECHATSTRQGDVEEVRALKAFFDPSGRTVLTSFKSQIGHTLGASGIGNLIRGTMAMNSGIFPPTLNYQHPDPAMGLEGSGLLVAPEPLDWQAKGGGPRRFQVNAFGFGGSNYVMQVEQDRSEAATLLVAPNRVLSLPAAQASLAPAAPAADRSTVPSGSNAPSPLAGEVRGGSEEVLCRGAADPAIPGVSFFRTEVAGCRHRMAVVAPSDAQALATVESSVSLAQVEMGSSKELHALAQKGIFFSPEDLSAPPLALVFPGQGAQYVGMGRELYESFPVIRHWMDLAAAAAEFDLLQLLFHDREENLQKTRWQQPALFALEHAMARYLTSLGVRPVAMAGHSLGELTALCMAGVFSAEDGFRIVNKRALCMDKASAMHGDPGTMAAVDAPLELLKELLQGQSAVHIGNINSPQQVVLSGKTEELRTMCKKLKEMGYRATFLRVSMAFHSPIMEVIHDELQAYVANIEFKSPEIPVISNTTMAPYPSDPVEIKRILMAHLESPVQWMNNVQTLESDYGVKLFVEVGPGEALSNLIADTLSGSSCIQTCFGYAEGATYQAALAQLHVQGHLKLPAEPTFVFLPGSEKTSAAVAASSVQAPAALAEVSADQSPIFPAPPAAAQPDAVPATTDQTAPVCAATHVDAALMGQLIGIIMEATGFEREEIQPAMDLRRDLSIRSSRLPIIMDAAERSFEITIEMEDFLDVRTVEDIAQRIAGIMVRQGIALPQSIAVPSIAVPTVAVPGVAVPGVAVQRPEAQPAPPVAVVAVQASPAGNATPPEDDDLMEQLIRIIMDSTGFERDEVQPGMDLRRDLSIRSSRLPIIMDAAERQFGIIIEMEDFLDVRTVADIAQRIAMILAREGSAGQQPESGAAIPQPEIMAAQTQQEPKAADCAAVREETRKPFPGDVCLKRIVFDQVAVEAATSNPVSLSPGESVLLLAPDGDNAIAAALKDALRQDYGVNAQRMLYLRGNSIPGEKTYNLLTHEGAGKASESIAVMADLAGLIITLPHDGPEGLPGMANVSRLLGGLFLQLKTFLRSPKKKFVVLVHRGADSETSGQLLAEGMLGIFLSAAQEYSSVQFRTLAIDRNADLQAALRGALDKGCSPVELVQRDGKLLTSAGHSAPVLFAEASGLKLSPGDVIVMSGGATGISAGLARSLAPFQPRLVFLGRTTLDPSLDPAAQPLTGQAQSDRSAASQRGSEIAGTLADLRSLGVEASYHTCDVSDPEAVRATLGDVIRRYGRIDGIVHGAGLLRDGLLGQMTPEDFSAVVDVKFLGAWNLFSAAQGCGLRFFVGLSSAAAIQGNPGQANYAAANRMMSGLLSNLRRENDGIIFKALALPPIDGAGMAENPELRELLQLKGVGYIHADELAGLFCRELMIAPAKDVWVMFMRTLPTLKTAPTLITARPALAGTLDGGVVSLRAENFPMIAGVSTLDLRREEIEATRTFTLEQDLWIAEHRPFTFLEHPLVSATMVLETFMEAARMLYPHLQVRGVRQVRFIDMIQCPPGVPRPARISCHRVDNGLSEVACEAVLAAPEITPAGRLTDRFIPHYKGQVILDGAADQPCEGFGDFPVRPDELRSGPMNGDQVLRWYTERSGLTGRYRVLESLDGAGPGAVRGRTSYRETTDFAHLGATRYQYPVYLFEALLQLAGFYFAATDPAERRSMIPLEVGEMRFTRQCRAGEPILLEARLRLKDNEGLTWDARGVDAAGNAIMQIHNLRMQWVSQ